MRDPSRVVVTGPLAAHAGGFCAELGRRGHARASAADLVQLMAHLSRWLGSEHLQPAGLTAEVAGRFLADGRERYRRRLAENAVRPLLGYLRDAGVAPGAARQDNDTRVARVLTEYRQYLVGGRGLAPARSAATCPQRACSYLRCRSRLARDRPGAAPSQPAVHSGLRQG
jgi:integrase/recombinase XerD